MERPTRKAGNTTPLWSGQGSRHARGYGSAWVKLREVVLIRDGYLCQECLRNGRPTPLGVRPYDHAVDHIIPKAKDGTDDIDNLQALCSDCHDIKTASDEGYRIKPAIGADGWPE